MYMYRFVRWTTVLTALVIISVPAVAQRIKVSTQTVPIYVTATDGDNRLVADLLQEDFEVYDNGKLQTVTTFSNQPTPITVVVMLDTSGSMTLSLDLVKQGAEQFLMRMLPGDKGMVGAFNDKIQFIPASFTEDRDQLTRALKDLDFGYPTRLFDAVDQSMEQLGGAEGRKVVLVFTDGEDSASKIGSGDVLARSRAEEVMIYSVGLASEYFAGNRKVRTSPDRNLRRFSEETGGGYFPLKKSDELGPTFTRIAQELRSQYILGFSPETLDGKVHKLEVRIKRPGTTPRARKSYIAGAAANPKK